MKTIRYTKEFTRPDGFPFYIKNPDPAVIEATIMEASGRGQLIAHVPEIPAESFADIIIMFMNGMPHERDAKGQPVRPQNAEDIGNNYAVIKAFRAAKVSETSPNTVELDESVYLWLVKQVNLEGPTAFGNSQAEVALRLIDPVDARSEALKPPDW